MRRKDWALLVIAVANGKPISPVQLQKSLFLFEKYVGGGLEDFYEFTPYNYGPFDSSVYLDAQELSSEGLVVVRRAEGQRWNEYVATSAGLNLAKVLEGDLPAQHVEMLHRTVELTRRLSFQELVRAVYEKFPEYRVRSTFR